MTSTKLSEDLHPVLAALLLELLQLSHSKVTSTGTAFGGVLELAALQLAASGRREVRFDIQHLVKLQEKTSPQSSCPLCTRTRPVSIVRCA